MDAFFLHYKEELLSSLITIFVVLVLKFIFTKAVRKVGKLGDFNKVRTNLIVKYISIALTIISIGVFTLIWSVNFKEIGALLASVFAVIGVALFAQWSILSNITAGVIIFFSYPFKIGNTIRVYDKEIQSTDKNGEEVFIIEDIRAFHLHLRRNNGEILTYPNSLILQKGVSLVNTYSENLGQVFAENED
ncbi:mechanosensitive ion channel [Cellulophaga sp. HaHaR_3_176]|uniref:mechanosensitive ion channel domain-containing protein n=1 Tax=Cellulophaga sp. HaHaR_3_176 TaxID=1942464 RepID=UPI001C1FB53C|nr:mechanosensitive ion channel domain-containing protein [Cellulophaga sp. HaHaR_3_176]QWX84914.1 mechanosensitive ion channel [Cellulophaga sp. HaHaR_3_176]